MLNIFLRVCSIVGHINNSYNCNVMYFLTQNISDCGRILGSVEMGMYPLTWPGYILILLITANSQVI